MSGSTAQEPDRRDGRRKTGEADAAPFVVRPIRCIHCQYELVGLPADGKCPECGTPVRVSTARLLIFQRPTFFRGAPLPAVVCATSRLALTLMLIFIPLHVMLVISVVLMAVLAYFDGNTNSILVPIFALPVFVPMAVLRSGRLVGSWLLTFKDPTGEGDPSVRFARWTLRVSILVQMLTMWLVVTPLMLYFGPTVFFLAIAAHLVALCFDFFSTMYIVGTLVARVPAPELAERAAQYIYLLPTITIILTAVPLFGPGIPLILYWRFMADVRAALMRLEEGAV
jgi:hypothetical protein